MTCRCDPRRYTYDDWTGEETIEIRHQPGCEEKTLAQAVVIIENLLEGAPDRIRDARLFLDKMKVHASS